MNIVSSAWQTVRAFFGSSYLGLRIIISCIAIALVVARMIWPDLKVDMITLGLGILALLPWLAYLVESASFPGGWEVKFRDLKAAGEQIATQGTQPTPTHEMARLNAIADQDPNLALVYLRIEIEKRLRDFTEKSGMNNSRMPLALVIRELQKRELISADATGGIQEIVRAGNSAAHGAKVEPSVADWAINYGPGILSALDEMLLK